MKKIEKAQTGAKLTPQQKRAKLDSITAVRRADIVRKKDSMVERSMRAAGYTDRAAYNKAVEQRRKQPDAQLEGLEIGKACKRGATKGSCSTGQANKGESLKDTRRYGGKINSKKK